MNDNNINNMKRHAELSVDELQNIFSTKINLDEETTIYINMQQKFKKIKINDDTNLNKCTIHANHNICNMYDCNGVKNKNYTRSNYFC